MKRFSIRFSLLLVAISYLALLPRASAQTVLLQDDFADGFIDPALWTTETSTAPPFFLPRPVAEAGGSMTIQNGGYLVTASQYDPVANEGIRIRGSWRGIFPGDVLTVVSRSDGSPSTNNFKVNQGIACQVTVGAPFNSVAIKQLNAGFETPLVTGNLFIAPGETFTFELVDDGTVVTFSLFRIGVETPALSISAPSALDSPTDRVVFHNSYGNFLLAFLDDVSIESLAVVEEPATPEEVIVDTVEAIAEIELPKGTGNALTSKLDGALLDLTLGDIEDAIGKLNAFIHQVNAQSGKKISSADAELLIEAAESILALIEEELEA